MGWDISDVALEQVPHLKLISFTGIGAGKFINLDIARRRGITVTNTPGYADVTVAEHTLGLMLDLARHITRLDRNTRAGGWNKGIQGRDLSGQTLGLLGFGGIAREVARLANAFGMEVLAWTRNPDRYRHAAPDVRFLSIDEVVERADIVSIHAAHTAETEGLLNPERIDRMREGALLINTGRGELVDEDAMVAALQSGQLGGAALDVFMSEPLPRDHVLLGMEHVVLTPHVAHNTPGASARILDIAIDNLASFYAGQPQNVVT